MKSQLWSDPLWGCLPEQDEGFPEVVFMSRKMSSPQLLPDLVHTSAAAPK